MITPGVYRMSFRGLTLAECWRLGGLAAFPLALVLKAAGKRGNLVWLPTSQSEHTCPPDELTEEARTRLALVIGQLQALGYLPGRFRRVIRNVDRSAKDAGAYAALHSDGKRAMFAGYVHCQVEVSGQVSDRKTVSVTGSFVTGATTTVDVIGHKNYLDDGGQSRKIRLQGATPAAIHARLEREMRQARTPVQRFADIDRFLDAMNSVAERAWEQRIRRGLYVKLSPAEEQAVLAQFPPAQGQS